MTFYNQHSTALVGAAGQPQGHFLEDSLRLRQSASAYLNRTPTSAGNRKTWTWSAWVKRGNLTTSFGKIWAAGVDNTGAGTNIANSLFFHATEDRLEWSLYGGGFIATVAKFRDPSAWYHIVLSIDTTQSTASDRIKIYVNGVQQTLSGTYWMSLNTDYAVNNTTNHTIGKRPDEGSSNFDGYLTEINFIDGQSLDASYFGETDDDTGVWKPKAYAGTYGTNGFYLNFSDNTSTTTLGYDQSSNSNNWTTNNISLTAGSTYDSMTDVPTLTSASAGNFCTLNPLSTAGGTFSNGNLDWSSPNATDARLCLATIPVNNFNCYCEVTIGSFSGNSQVGVFGSATAFNPRVMYRNDGARWIDGTQQSGNWSSFTTNDIIGITYNASTGSVSFYKNNTLQGSMTVSNTNTTQYFAAGSNSTGTANYTFNFGQRPFAYTPPTGYKALNTYNLPDSTVKDGGDYFNTVLYTGDGSTTSKAISGVGFQPDFVWIKNRNDVSQHSLMDIVRGKTGSYFKQVRSDDTDAEQTLTSWYDQHGGVLSLDSDGFTVKDGTDGTYDFFNGSGDTYVAWNWKANGSGVSNTDGSITSTVSANTTSGFSIVTYTGTGSTATVGHGLGTAPYFVMFKNRSVADGWWCYHVGLSGPTYAIELNTTTTEYISGNPPNWNMTSTTMALTAANPINRSGSNLVAYCFAPIEGYSAFGKYTGNGSTDGPFVYTGFRPAFVVVKTINGHADSWFTYDSARDSYNPETKRIKLDTSGSESTDGLVSFDFVSNGFKLRSSNQGWNENGTTYIYAAFAENPFKYSLAR